MNKAYLVCIAAALLGAPLALAHFPAGTPKTYCEPRNDWAVHDYGPVATGFFNFAPTNGNLGGDCDGSSIILGDPGTPCAGFEDPNNPLTFFFGLCGADIRSPLGEWDGHYDFGQGGAWLLVNDGPGTPGSGGTLDCWGAEGHHTEFGSYAVDDVVLGSGASFTIAADRVDAASAASGGTTPPNPCGDNFSDEVTDCIGSCAVPFGAGLDGTYQVYVQGTLGHICDGGCAIDSP